MRNKDLIRLLLEHDMDDEVLVYEGVDTRPARTIHVDRTQRGPTSSARTTLTISA